MYQQSLRQKRSTCHCRSTDSKPIQSFNAPMIRTRVFLEQIQVFHSVLRESISSTNKQSEPTLLNRSKCFHVIANSIKPIQVSSSSEQLQMPHTDTCTLTSGSQEARPASVPVAGIKRFHSANIVETEVQR